MSNEQDIKHKCWNCDKDITNEKLPHSFVGGWNRPHCKKCYEMKSNWINEVRQEVLE